MTARYSDVVDVRGRPKEPTLSVYTIRTRSTTTAAPLHTVDIHFMTQNGRGARDAPSLEPGGLPRPGGGRRLLGRPLPRPGGYSGGVAGGEPVSLPACGMYEGALSFITDIFCSYRDSPYKRGYGR